MGKYVEVRRRQRSAEVLLLDVDGHPERTQRRGHTDTSQPSMCNAWLAYGSAFIVVNRPLIKDSYTTIRSDHPNTTAVKASSLPHLMGGHRFFDM